MQGWDSEIVVTKKPQQKQKYQVKQQQQQPQQQQPQQQESSSGYKPRFMKKSEGKSEKQKLQEKFQQEDNGEKNIIFRSKMGVYLSQCYIKGSNNLENSEKIEENMDHLQITKDGKRVLMSSRNKIVSYDIESKKVLGEITGLASVQNIKISNTEKYIQYVDRQDKNKFIIGIMSFPELNKVLELCDQVYIKENFPPVKMNDDDSLAFKYHFAKQVINVFKFKDDGSTPQVLKQYRVGVIDHFSVAPCNIENPTFNTSTLEKQKGFKVSKGIFHIYDMNNDKPIIEKVLEKAQEITPKWSKDGENLLIKVESMQDQTNQSYYGQNRLFHYSTKNKEFKLVPTYEGPVHDFKWSPNGENFCAVSGFIPSKAVLFDKNGTAVYDFGTGYKNTVIFSNLNRFLILAGFGNLNGEISIWDTKEQKKVGECKSSSASVCYWSNDGRKFMTGTVTPALRVENNFKIFKYDGTLIHKSDFNSTELYQVEWSNREQKEEFQDRPGTPKSQQQQEEEEEKKAEEKKQEKKVFQAYRGGSNSGGMSFAEEMRLMKKRESDGGKIQKGGNDGFGSQKMQGTGAQLKPGQTESSAQPVKQKKKRIRKKDMQKQLENLENEGDNL